MPREWHDKHAVNKIEDEAMREFYFSIVADKKPYFMRYIYPDLMKQYNTYRQNTDRSALREFDKTVSELYECEDRTDDMNEFLRYYEMKMPVGTGDCVMNKICRRFEDEFDGFTSCAGSDEFDYSMYKSGARYTQRQYDSMVRLHKEYNSQLRRLIRYCESERVDTYDMNASIKTLSDEFLRECADICQSDDVMGDIMLDICYTRVSTKRFVWNLMPNVIVRNLLTKNDSVIKYPAMVDAGDISFRGKEFVIVDKILEEYNEYNLE